MAAEAARGEGGLHVLESREGRDEVELLEDEAERPKPQSRELAVPEAAELAVRTAAAPSRSLVPVVELAVGLGPNASTTTAATTPSPIPSRPPARPCATDSPTTCRTTSRCVQPIAFSVPSSRTRLPTEERVSSAARRNAAAAARIPSTRPRLCERFDASTSEPLIRSATSCALATCAPGSLREISFWTAPTEDPLSALTRITFARPF